MWTALFLKSGNDLSRRLQRITTVSGTACALRMRKLISRGKTAHCAVLRNPRSLTRCKDNTVFGHRLRLANAQAHLARQNSALRCFEKSALSHAV